MFRNLLRGCTTIILLTLKVSITYWRHFTICRMSENNQPDPELLQVEGILDLTDNKSGVLLDPSRVGKPLLTIRSYPEN